LAQKFTAKCQAVFDLPGDWGVNPLLVEDDPLMVTVKFDLRVGIGFEFDPLI